MNKGHRPSTVHALAVPFITLAIGLSFAAQRAAAQSAASDLPPELEQLLGKAARASATQPNMRDFNEVVKDMQPIDGLLTLYRHNPNDPSKDHTRLLCKVPRQLIGQDLLMANSVSRGENYGFPLDDGLLVRWEINGNRVLLVAPDPRYVDTPGAIVSSAVSNTYTPIILMGFEILALGPSAMGGNQDPVIDLSSMVFGDITGAMGFFGYPRRDLSRYTKVKSFPENVLIDVDLAVSGRGMGGATGSIGITYSLRKLPQNSGYTPRVADERVGYFTSVRQDWGMKHSERENVVRYVNRWNLKKKDPSLELSPPEKPIVFIIEKTVPLQWRKYVAEGILGWNKSFEKIGYTGAVVAQQQADDNEFATVDPEDARYNFFRWIVTGSPFAMGPSRPDPRTGQLLDADIIFDDSFLRYEIRDFEVFGPRASAAMMGPEILDFYKKYPQFIPAGQSLTDDAGAALGHGGGGGGGGGGRIGRDQELLTDCSDTSTNDVRTAAAPRKLPWLRRRGASYTRCTYGEGMRQQMALTQLAMLAAASSVPAGQKIPDRIVGQIIKEVVSHEVGHTLGLRHNFKASSWLSLEEIKKRRDTTDDPTFASVMDYNPVLFFPGDQLDKLRNVISPCIGPYDEWAIEYGYKQFDKEENENLAKVAARGTAKELAYATDEDTYGLSSVDPLSNRYDMSDDPMGWAKSRIELVDTLMKDVKNWAVKKDEPVYHLRTAFATLMYEKARNLYYAARFVGGQYMNRNRMADPDSKPSFALVDPKMQRDMLQLINESLFKDTFFSTADPELLNWLAANRWDDWFTYAPVRTDYPVHNVFLSMQAQTLSVLTSPQVFQRIYDSELKSKADNKFTSAELIRTVRDMVFSELTNGANSNGPGAGGEYTDAKPMISSIRRNLQEQYVSNMLATAGLPQGAVVSPDLQSSVRYALRELSDNIGATLDKSTGGATKIDFASRGHLREMKSRIDRVLEKPMIDANSGSRYIILGQTPGQN